MPEAAGTERHYAGRTTHSPHTLWPLVLVGILGIVAGIIVLAQPAISLATLAVVTGIFLLVDGIFETVEEIFDTNREGGFLGVILAVASVIVGVLLIRHPLHGVVALALLFGLWLIVAAMIRLATALAVERRRGWNLGVALVELVAGIVIVSTPSIGVRTLALLVGIAWIVRGLALVAIGWLVPRFVREFDSKPSGPVTAT